MKKFLLLGALLGMVFSGCGRTHIPVFVQRSAEETKEASCSVRDHGSAATLPSGSIDLGRVEAPRDEVDEHNTYGLLNRKVCELGGNAITGVRWEVELGMPKPRALSGNAWKLP